MYICGVFELYGSPVEDYCCTRFDRPGNQTQCLRTDKGIFSHYANLNTVNLTPILLPLPTALFIFESPVVNGESRGSRATITLSAWQSGTVRWWQILRDGFDSRLEPIAFDIYTEWLLTRKEHTSQSPQSLLNFHFQVTCPIWVSHKPRDLLIIIKLLMS